MILSITYTSREVSTGKHKSFKVTKICVSLFVHRTFIQDNTILETTITLPRYLDTGKKRVLVNKFKSN